MTPKLPRFIRNHLKLTDCECVRAENSSEPSGCQWWPNAVWRQLSIYPLSNRRRLYKSLPGRNTRDAGIRKGKCNADGFSVPFLNHCLVSFFSNFNGFYRSRFVSKTFLSVNTKIYPCRVIPFESQLISTGGQCSPKMLRGKSEFCVLFTLSNVLLCKDENIVACTTFRTHLNRLTEHSLTNVPVV